MTGLTTQQAQDKLLQVGPNEIPDRQKSLLQKITAKIISPISIMLVAASALSLATGRIFDFYFILILLVVNQAISLWQENKADNAIKKLNENLTQAVKVFRDNQWQMISSRLLVPGDTIQLSSGEIIPADGRVIESDHTLINESALTGESLPREKAAGSMVYSGSFLTSGIITIEVTATGRSTSFGRTIFKVDTIRKTSLLEKDILSISKFLIILSLIAVVILSSIFLIQGTPLLDLLTLDLSLIIAGIPISLPTVMTLIIEIGVLHLAQKSVIVRRLSALEDLSNVNLLLTDKTGTLTQNRISVQDVYAYSDFNHNDVLSFASQSASLDIDNPISKAILDRAGLVKIPVPDFSKVDFIPADSQRKRSTLTARTKDGLMVISAGAPQVISKLCRMDPTIQEKFSREVAVLAKNGNRAIAVAVSKSRLEKQMEMVGLLALSDTLREDAPSVVEFLVANGVSVSIVTGDNGAIASQIASRLNLKGDIVTKQSLDQAHWDKLGKDFFLNTAAFAEILPEDKFKLVELAKVFFVVASNGDGVNDLPALKAASVGIAVKSAVTALKSTADIVLLSEGISVIKDALIESRKIFERLYTYSVYRLSESFRLITTVAVLGIIYRVYPLTALQIIVIALLNDIPIISLAVDRVKTAPRPARINTKQRFTLSTLYGLTGVLNSLLLFFLMNNLLHISWGIIQTIYFLKLTVSGHMLIFVAHTKERWWRFLPAKEVMIATALTQLAATTLALTGWLMPEKAPIGWVVVVWVWSFLWMQISEMMKDLSKLASKPTAANN